MSSEAATTYAREVVATAFAEGGDNAVVARIADDLVAEAITESDIRARMTELMAQAIAQVKAGV